LEDIKHALLQVSTDERLTLVPEEDTSPAQVGRFTELCLQSEAGIMMRQLVATLRLHAMNWISKSMISSQVCKRYWYITS
jgi:hypothetical protein